MRRVTGGDEGTRHPRARPRSEPRVDRRSSVLLRAQARDLTREEVLVRGERALTGAFNAARGWALSREWELGDYQVLSLVTPHAGGGRVYARWRFEPMEPVEAEMCLPRLPEEQWEVSPEGRKVLRRLGYRVGRQPSGYRKRVALDGAEGGASMAREALLALHDALEYRGRTRLELHVVRDRRSRPALVHDSVTPEDVVRLAMAGGDLAEVKVSPSGHPVVFASGEAPWLVHLPWPAVPPNQYAGLHFYRLVPRPAVLDAEAINRINGGLLFGKIVLDEDGDLAVTMDVRVGGGVTTEWLAQVLRQWHEVFADAEARLTAAKETLATMAAAAQIISAKGLLQE